MSTWTARRLAWSVGIVSIVLMVAALVLMFVDRESDLPKDVGDLDPADVLDVVVNIGVPILGIVIVNKRPGTRSAGSSSSRGSRSRSRPSDRSTRSTSCSPIPDPCRPAGSWPG